VLSLAEATPSGSGDIFKILSILVLAGVALFTLLWLWSVLKQMPGRMARSIFAGIIAAVVVCFAAMCVMVFRY